MSRLLTYCFLILLLSGCQNPVQENGRQLLNVNELLVQSFEHYRQQPPALMTKTVNFGEELQNVEFDTTEFGDIDTLFRGVNINKSAYLNSYYIKDQLLQKASINNVHHLSYQIKEKETALVKRLDYFYLEEGDQQKPLALLILKKDFNKLYRSTQIIQATFQDSWLHELSIHGDQDILLRDPSSYSLTYRFNTE